MGERAESMEARIDAIVEWIRHFEEVHWHPTYEKQIDVLIDRNLRKCPTRKEPPMAPGSEKDFDDDPYCAHCGESVSVKADCEFNEGDLCNECLYVEYPKMKRERDHLESLLAVAVEERDRALLFIKRSIAYSKPIHGGTQWVAFVGGGMALPQSVFAALGIGEGGT